MAAHLETQQAPDLDRGTYLHPNNGLKLGTLVVELGKWWKKLTEEEGNLIGSRTVSTNLDPRDLLDTGHNNTAYTS